MPIDVRKMFDLTGHVALVTGGAGLYGTPISEALAEAGAHVIPDDFHDISLAAPVRHSMIIALTAVLAGPGICRLAQKKLI
jgi:NAD(P)-dependent dehydrogenase (short-subunit alcohol dehydrogenase family)